MKKTRFFLLILLIVGMLAALAVPVVADGETTPSIAGHNLALEDNIWIVYYVDASVPTGAESGVLVWLEPQESYTYANATYRVNQSFGTITNPNTGNLCRKYAFKELSAKMMTVDVYAVPYRKVGGSVIYGALDKYSVLQYAYNKKGSTASLTGGSATLGEVVHSVLEYGATTQKYFNYRTDRLANATYYTVNVVNGTLSDGTTKGLYPAGAEVALTGASPDAYYWKNSAGDLVTNPVTVPAKNETYTATLDEAPEGTPIRSAEELRAIQNNAATDPKAKYYLTEDIFISNEWSFFAGREAGFEGTLNGNGHTIYFSHATIIGGLFGVLRDGATIKKLNIVQLEEVTYTNVVRAADDETFYTNVLSGVGALAGRVADGRVTIENVKAHINIDDNNSDICGTPVSIGGLIGEAQFTDTLTIRGCVAIGSLTGGATNKNSNAQSSMGGILGKTISTSGNATVLIIEECVNYMDITGTTRMGGIFGYNYYTNTQNDYGVKSLTIKNCANYGTISSNYTGEGEATESGAGGILGRRVNHHDDQTLLIGNVNYGTIIGGGNTQVGGIAGHVQVSRNDGYEDYLLEICGNVNYGEVDGTKAASIVSIYRTTTDGYIENNNAQVPNYHNDGLADVILSNEMAPGTAKKFTGTVFADADTDATLAVLNAAVANTYVIGADGRIALKWANAAGYTADYAKEFAAYISTGNSIPYNEILKFVSNGDGTCYVSYLSFYRNTDITIPSVSPDGDRVTSIRNSAFYKNASLTSVTIPDSVTSIGDYAFYNCTNLTNVTFSDGLTCIGRLAFSWCTSLTSVTIPNSITDIGEYAFSSCTNLQYNRYDNASYLGNAENPYVALINGSVSSTSCTVHPNTKVIAGGAFENLIGYDVPYDSPCFYDDALLTNITIPNSVTSIGEYAFSHCRDLADITYAGTKAQWNAIKKETGWNYYTGSYTVHCTDGDIAK